MKLENGIKVNFNEYFDVLRSLGATDDVLTLQSKLKEFGIEGSATVYQGEKGDGNILITNDTGECAKGIMRFSERGELYEPLEPSDVTQIPIRAARVFISGLFGEEELTGISDQVTKGMIESLKLADGCYREGAISECNYESISNITTREFVKKGDRFWVKAAKLADLAKEQDKVPIFGIEWEELNDAYLSAAGSKPLSISTSAEAITYYIEARKLFSDLLENGSGHHTVEERASDIGCLYSESGGNYHDDGILDCKSQVDIEVNCPDVDANIKLHYDGYCFSSTDKKP